MKIIQTTIDTIPESEFNSDSVLFFDIETTGLSKENSQVYLIGCAYKNDEAWELKQYFAQSALDEREVLEEFLDFAQNFKTLVHFNGDRFDVPYIDFKSEFYGFDFKLSEMENFDIYKASKPLRKFLGLESMSQKAVERFLKIGRDDEMNGGELISYYFEYEKTKSKELEKFLLLHNFDDVKGMLNVLKITNYLGILDGDFKYEKFEENLNYVTFSLRLNKELPVPIELEKDGILIAGGDSYLEVCVPIIRGIASYELKDYENYYYLPLEDKVIHKDVAQFVDKKFKKKATKKNCCIKKEGNFILEYAEVFSPKFYIGNDKKKSYFELENLFKAENKQIEKYIKNLISNL